jgi:hypothetical protein
MCGMETKERKMRAKERRGEKESKERRGEKERGRGYRKSERGDVRKIREVHP